MHPLALWIVVAAASQLFDLSGASATVVSYPDAVHSTHRSEAVWVEFDLPAEFWEELFDGTYLVTGFRLGYFRTNGNDPLLTVGFKRAAVTVRGETGQLPLDVEWLTQSRERIVVRLQTLTADDESEWSAPSESISIGLALAWMGRTRSKADR